MIENKIADILTKTGLAGALIFTLYIGYVIVCNHMDHSTEAMIRNTAAFSSLEKTIEDNSIMTNNIIQQNTNAFQSFEQTILLKIK